MAEKSVKPIICCTGHDLLVAELETRCLLTISSEPVLWRHSKRCAPYPVRIDACFTRFNPAATRTPVKVLSSGRPVHRLGSSQPLLYIHVISNNHTQYSSGGGKQMLTNWLSQLHASNINDWIILMIDADPPSSGPRVWIKPDLFQKIKQDFNIPTDDRHFLRITDRRAVDEKTFEEAWTSLMRSLRRVILDICQSTIQDYDAHLRLLETAQESSGWDFLEYINRKEELVHLYLIVNGFEDALQEYFSLGSILSNGIHAAIKDKSEKMPVWIRQLRSVAGVQSVLSHFPTMDISPNTYQSQLIRDRNADLFILHSYFLSREISLLISLNRCHDIPSRALLHISAAIEESRLLKLDNIAELEHCWAFLCALNCLAVMFQANKVSEKSAGPSQSITAILTAAFGASGRVNHTFTIQDPALNKIKASFLSSNVFMQSSEALNPLARPLANLADGIYFSLTYNPTLLSPAASQDSPSKATACAQLVDLWLMAFLQLSTLANLLSLRYPPGTESPERNAAVLKEIKRCVDACASSDETNQAAFGASAHKYLHTILISRTLYAEIHISMAQTLIGFFNLMGQPRKALYLCSELAEFLTTTKRYADAFELYRIILSMYLREGWTSLASKLFMQFATGLRTFLDEMKHPIVWTSATQLEKCALIRYFDCCMILSNTSQSELQQTSRSLALTLSQNNPKQGRLTTSCSYWWSEADFIQQIFPNELVLDATFAVSSPISIDSVHLDGACEHGFQLITVTATVNAPVCFVVRITVTGTLPTKRDWYLIMDYGMKDDTENIAPPSLPMSTIDLCLAGLSTSEREADQRRPTEFQPPHLTRQDPVDALVKLRNNVFQSSAPNRKHSLMEMAASVASRPALRFQHQLLSHESNHTVNTLNTQLTVTTLDDRDQAASRRTSTVSAPCGHASGNMFSSSSQVSPESCKNVCFSEFSWMPQGENTLLFTLTDEQDLVTLKPGVNTLHFSAKTAGFLLPYEVHLEIVNRIPAENTGPTATTSATKDRPMSMKFLYRLIPGHFGPSWRCRQLLDSLLPKIRFADSLNEKCPAPINVVLGARQMIPLELQLGHLGLALDSNSTIQLYRIASNPNLAGFESRADSPPPDLRRSTSLVNDYEVTVSSHSVKTIPNVLEPDEEHHIGIPVLDPQDGPISLVDYVANEHDDPSHAKHPTSFIPPGSCVKLTRPLSLVSTADSNRFAISMPSGNLYRLPIRVLRPLAFQMNIQTLERIDTVLCSIQIACMDIPNSQSIETAANTKLTEPLTFKLTKFNLALSAPFKQMKSRATSPHVPQAGSNLPIQDVANVQSRSIKSKNNEPSSHGIPDAIVGVPVNDQYTEAYVNRLCPVSLLWRFRLSEFTPFVNTTLERFNKSPFFIFRCSFAPANDPVSESELTLTRRISSTRQHAMERASSVSNIFLKSRKDRLVT